MLSVIMLSVVALWSCIFKCMVKMTEGIELKIGSKRHERMEQHTLIIILIPTFTLTQRHQVVKVLIHI